MNLSEISKILTEGKYKYRNFAAVIFRFPSLNINEHIVLAKINGSIFDEYFIYSQHTKKIEGAWNPTYQGSISDAYTLEYNDMSMQSLEIMRLMINKVSSFLYIKENPEYRKFSMNNIIIPTKLELSDTLSALPKKDDILHEHQTDAINESEAQSMPSELPEMPKNIQIAEPAKAISLSSAENDILHNNTADIYKPNKKSKSKHKYVKKQDHKDRRLSVRNPANSRWSIPFTGVSFSPGWKNSRRYDPDNDNKPYKILTRMKHNGKVVYIAKREYEVSDVGLLEGVVQLHTAKLNLGLYNTLQLLTVDYEFMMKFNPATWIDALDFDSKTPWAEYIHEAITGSATIPVHSEIAAANRVPKIGAKAIPLDQIPAEDLESIRSINNEDRAHYYHYKSDEYIAKYGVRLPTKNEKDIKLAKRAAKKLAKSETISESTKNVTEVDIQKAIVDYQIEPQTEQDSIDSDNAVNADPNAQPNSPTGEIENAIE